MHMAMVAHKCHGKTLNSFDKTLSSWATLFGQLKIGKLTLASYLMQIRLDLKGPKI